MPYLRNTGMNSMSELFAMKKNMAFQAKFDHKMHSMSRDFYHRKDNMNQDIKKIFNDMRTIQSSTGYVLNEGEKMHRGNKTTRRPTLPKLYFPPIGVRLVKKYVGIDLERRKSLFDPSPVENGETGGGTNDELPRVSRSFRSMLLNEKTSGRKAVTTIDREKIIVPGKAKEESFTQNRYDDTVRGYDDKDGNVSVPVEAVVNQHATENSQETTFITLQQPEEILGEQQMNNNQINETADSLQQAYNDSKVDTDTSMAEKKNTPENEIQYMDDRRRVTFVSTARRSSRSTYRKRLSARTPTQSSLLRQHNLDVIESTGDFKTSKLPVTFSEQGKFFLDYGDGKLHTIMEIPKTKDCARPWCNPSCKTCQNRTMGKPCFILIPTGNAKQQSMLLVQKRRASVFPMFKEASTLSQDQGATSPGPVEYIDAEDTEDNTNNEDEEEYRDETQTDDEDVEEDSGETVYENTVTNELGKDAIEKIEKLLHINKERQKRGYDKKRLDQLALPRGGPPAEVRFSRWSLRKKQDQLTEKASTQQLSEYEKDNLSMIQGKISVFLALLNQYEATTVPKKMVHLPIREDIHTRRKKPKPKRPRLRRSVFFNDKVRSRLLS